MKSVVIWDSYDKWKPINPYHNPFFSLLDLHYVIKLFAKTSKPRIRTLDFLEIMDINQNVR
jgi:hypothetical protein